MIEQNNQKIIIIAGGVLFFIVILLIIFISIFSKKGTTIPGEPNSTNAPTPTTYKINPFTNKRGTPRPSGIVGSDEFPLKLNQEKDRAFLENLYRNIANDKRFKNKDFDLYYSEKYKKFVFIKKTADAEKRLAELLQNVGIDLNELIRTFATNPLSAAMIDLTNRQYSNNLSKTEMELLKEAYKNNPNLFKDAGINMTYDSETDTFFLEVNSQQEIDNFNNFASNSPYKNVLKDSDYIKLVNTSTINNQKTKEVTKDVIKLMFSNDNGRNTKPFNVLLNEQSKIMDVENPDSSERDIEETTTGRILKSFFSFNLKVPKAEENTTEFNVITRVPPQSSNNGGDDLPPIDTDGTDLSQLDYAAWGLPPPKAEDSGGARGYNRLLSQIRSGNGNWGALVLLEGERAAKKKGYNVMRYLNTAWIWFENGSASYPDPYQVNCNDDRPGFTSTSNSFCSSTNFQIAGYQAATRRKDYVSAFHKFYTDEQLQSVLQRVISNSSRASQSKWSYNGITIPSNITISNISPNADFFDPTIQKYTLILGKDPVIVAALNSYAVSSSDLIRVLKTQQCGYGYICATEKQILSNMAAALYILENGSLDAPGGGSSPGTGGGAASDNTQSVLAQAQRILPNLEKGTAYDDPQMFNRNVRPISGNGYTTPYREGRVEGTGSNGLFWCTNMVISSYRLAGFPELKEGAMEAVISMRQWWQQQKPGYLYVNYQTSNKLQALRNVKPGCAFFLEENGQHTGLVKSVNLDGNGNGSMVIYESNSGKTETTFPVANGVVKNTYGMVLVGFGCRK